MFRGERCYKRGGRQRRVDLQPAGRAKREVGSVKEEERKSIYKLDGTHRGTLLNGGL